MQTRRERRTWSEFNYGTKQARLTAACCSSQSRRYATPPPPQGISLDIQQAEFVARQQAASSRIPLGRILALLSKLPFPNLGLCVILGD